MRVMVSSRLGGSWGTRQGCRVYFPAACAHGRLIGERAGARPSGGHGPGGGGGGAEWKRVSSRLVGSRGKRQGCRFYGPAACARGRLIGERAGARPSGGRGPGGGEGGVE